MELMRFEYTFLQWSEDESAGPYFKAALLSKAVGKNTVNLIQCLSASASHETATLQIKGDNNRCNRLHQLTWVTN